MRGTEVGSEFSALTKRLLIMKLLSSCSINLLFSNVLAYFFRLLWCTKREGSKYGCLMNVCCNSSYYITWNAGEKLHLDRWHDGNNNSIYPNLLEFWLYGQGEVSGMWKKYANGTSSPPLNSLHTPRTHLK